MSGSTTSTLFPANLTILEEDDHIDLQALELNYSIVGKLPEHIRDELTAHELVCAVQNQFGIPLHPHRVTRYGPDYLIRAPSSKTYNILLANPAVSVLTGDVMLFPWTKDHGCTIGLLGVDAETAQANSSRQPPHPTLANTQQAIDIEISGILAHLWSTTTVRRLLSSHCTVASISFMLDTAWVQAYTTDLPSMPHKATLGVKKTIDDRLFLKMWPIWYRILPQYPMPRDQYINAVFNLEADQACVSPDDKIPIDYGNNDNDISPPHLPGLYAPVSGGSYGA